MTLTNKLGLLCCAGMLWAVGCQNVTTTVSTGELKADNMKMAASKGGEERSNRTFKKGETVWVSFDIKGFKQADDGNIWVQEDIDVTAPDGKSILHKDNVLDFHQKADKGADNLQANNDITLPQAAGPGSYAVKISLRDKIGSGTSTVNSTFTEE